MPGCVLHVVGENLDGQAALSGLVLEPYSVYHAGDRVFPQSKKVHRLGGFKCDVSLSDGDLVQEVADAIAFLTKYKDDLRRLGSTPGVESMCLDFGYDLRVDGKQCIFQSDFLPPELL